MEQLLATYHALSIDLACAADKAEAAAVEAAIAQVRSAIVKARGW